MKSSRLAVGLVGLCFVGLWYSGGGSSPLPASRAADVPQVSAPLTHANLSVYLVFGPDAVTSTKLMSLQEALDRDLATVHETGNVNTLAVENRSSEYELFVQSGDIVKGGRQDRMVQHDMLLPPNSGRVPLPAHCVEQSRWTNRGKEDAGKFAKCDNFAAGRALRYANYAGEQHAVWANVSQSQKKASDNLGVSVNAAASPTSFQLTLESDAVRAKVAEYEAALKGAAEDRNDVVGVVFAVNGQVVAAEVYGSNALFRKAWPKLLTAAAAEAVIEGNAPASAAPSTREVEYFLAHGADAEPAGEVLQTEGRGERFQSEGRPQNLAVQTGRGWQDVGRAQQRAVFFMELNDAEPLRRDQQNLNRAAANINDNLQTLANPTGAPGRAANDNVVAEESGRARIRISMRGVGQPDAPAAGNNNDGNRLNSSANENRSTLMVESRDSGRANAVIHRSYLKK